MTAKTQEKEVTTNDNKLELKIEKGIPAPPAGVRGKSSHAYKALLTACLEMTIGDSVVFPSNGTDKDCSVYACAKKAGIKITKRRIDKGHIRIWRIE